MKTNFNKIGKQFAANAVNVRQLSDLNISQYASATGVSTRTLRRIEQAQQGRRPYRPMLATVVKLAAAAQVSVDDFIKGKLYAAQ